jgi:hypothetical protein
VLCVFFVVFYLLKTKNFNSITKVVQSGYLVEVNNEHVMLGNAGLLKCTIPSFVTDFVRVAAWTIYDSNDGNILSSLDPDSTGILKLNPFN